jgi:hypothetical protein
MRSAESQKKLLRIQGKLRSIYNLAMSLFKQNRVEAAQSQSPLIGPDQHVLRPFAQSQSKIVGRSK